MPSDEKVERIKIVLDGPAIGKRYPFREVFGLLLESGTLIESQIRSDWEQHSLRVEVDAEFPTQGSFVQLLDVRFIHDFATAVAPVLPVLATIDIGKSLSAINSALQLLD